MVVATTGFFDGVHLGHHQVIDRLLSVARRKGARSAVFTFWPHPRFVLGSDPEKLRLLMSIDEKEDRLRRLGVEEINIIPFTPDFSRLTGAEFMKFIREEFGVTTLIVGYDHRIGSDSLSQEPLVEAGTALGLEMIMSSEIDCEEAPISSTRIRRLLDVGEITLANNLLGYRYPVHGDFRDGVLVPSEPLKLIPGDGTYDVVLDGVAGTCRVADRQIFPEKACSCVEFIEKL